MEILYDMIIAILSIAGVLYIFDFAFLFIHKPKKTILIQACTEDRQILEFLKKNYINNIDVRYEE